MVGSEEGTTRPGPITPRRVLIALLALAAVAAIVYVAVRPAPSSTSPRHLPQFSLSKLGGGSVSRDDLKGHPVVVNFFASWCKQCKQEVGLLQDAYDSTRAHGVRFIGVATNDVDADTRSFVSQHRLSYPVVFDHHARLANKMRVFGLPETFFVAPNGTYVDAIRGHKIGTRKGTVVLGPLTDQRLQEGLRELMSLKGAG